jgi:alkylated DNA nucleotide flippase Atl1
MWKTVFKELPNDEAIVWIRVLNIYGEITLAKWSQENQMFEVLTTGVLIPAYFCARWKSQ